MTYNVENFWGDQNADSPLRYKDYSHRFSNWVREGMTDKKAKKIAEAIGIANYPDVIGLQEIESAHAPRLLDKIANHLQDFGYLWYAPGLQEPTNPVNVTTAVLSKWPIVNNQNIPFHMRCPAGEAILPLEPSPLEKLLSELTGSYDDCERASRDPQVVDINLGYSRLRVYNAHWKSRRGTSKAVKGMHKAMAQLLQNHIASTLENDPLVDVVLLGDFNSDYRDKILREDLGVTGDVERVLNGSKLALYDLWFDQPQPPRCSYFFGGVARCYDHIVLAPTVFDNVGIKPKAIPSEASPGSTSSLQVVGWGNDPEEKKLLGPDQTPFRWQYQLLSSGYSKHIGEGYSDHLPLVAHFSLIAPENHTDKREWVPVERGAATAGRAKSRVEASPKPCPTFMLLSSFLHIPKQKFEDNTCIEFNMKTLWTLEGIDRYQVGLKQGQHAIVVTMTDGFGKNKRYLREVLQKSTGKKLKKIKGRLGMSQGFPAIFVEKPEDIDIQ